ncbi:MAG: magnesium transporter [Verrucomicrobiales bacterium]|jgi:magnesium transporter
MESAINRSQRYIESTLQNGSLEELQGLFAEVHPADLAKALEELEDDRFDAILAQMPPEVFGELVEHMPATDAVEHLENSDEKFRKEALANLADDELVDLLQEIPEANRSGFVELLSEDAQEKSRKLMAFPEESAGGRMTTDISTISEAMTIREAIEKLAAVKETSELLSRIYVVDDRGRLLGKVRLRDLTFNPRDQKISEIMDGDLLSIDAFEDQEEAARMMTRYDLVALPVINADLQVIGAITHDDAMEILEEEASEDIEKLSGIQASDPDATYLRISVMGHFRLRFAWVVSMAFLAIISGFVLYKYEHVLSSISMLALYIPMVVAAGGNTGSQSATMVIRAMSLGEFNTKDFLSVIWKEVRIGMLLGALVGISVFVQIQIFQFGSLPSGVSLFSVALVVSLSLMIQITTSTLLGSSLPLLARLMRADPAAVASPVITTVVDVTGMLIYFLLATTFIPLATT